MPFPGATWWGALLFTIGLFTVCTRGYALFTGKACYLFDNPLPAYLLDLLVFWVGNLLGAMLIAGLEHLTGMVGGETGIDATAAALVEGKMGATYLGLFVLGILCNICIFIAVNGYANNPHQVGKYLALFLGVSVLSSAAPSTAWPTCITGRSPGCFMRSRGSRFSAF